MKPPKGCNTGCISRRNFLGQSLGTGMALPFSPLFSASEKSAQNSESGRRKAPVLIQVKPPAGPPPIGAPVETCVPFARGQLSRPEMLAVFSPGGQTVVTQTRVAMPWPDGSVRWLTVVFEAASGPGTYALKEGKAPAFDGHLSAI